MKFSAFANIPQERPEITLLKALGTDRQVAALLCRDDGHSVSRSTVRLWRRGEAKVPGWAIWQMRNIAIKRNDESLRPLLFTLGVPDRAYTDSIFNPQHWANWKRLRRDGKPMHSMLCKMN